MRAPDHHLAGNDDDDEPDARRDAGDVTHEWSQGHEPRALPSEAVSIPSRSSSLFVGLMGMTRGLRRRRILSDAV